MPTAVLVDGDGSIAGSVTRWDQPALAALLSRAARLAGAELDLPDETEPLRKPGRSSKAAIDPELAAAMAASGGVDELEEMFERGWTDGLPVIPPTRERVDAMLGGRDGAASIGHVPPAHAIGWFHDGSAKGPKQVGLGNNWVIAATIILSFRVIRGCDLRRLVEDGVVNETAAA